MIYLKTDDEVELLREANILVGKTLGEMAKLIRPGVTTRELDKVAEEFIRDHGATPTFLGFPNPYGGPFPASICTSVNDQVVHGIPNDTPLQEGDIVSIDCGTCLNGYCGDSCYTFPVGEVSEEVIKLMRTTKEALYKGIEQAVVGHRIGDISYAVQQHCVSNGYGVVREFVGHGIGKQMPVTVWCFLIAALSLVGIPPMGGFLSKWVIALASVDSGMGVFSVLPPVILLISALLTAGYLFPVAFHAFFPGEEFEGSSEKREPNALMLVPMILLCAAALTVGLFGVSILGALGF